MCDEVVSVSIGLDEVSGMCDEVVSVSIGSSLLRFCGGAGSSVVISSTSCSAGASHRLVVTPVAMSDVMSASAPEVAEAFVSSVMVSVVATIPILTFMTGTSSSIDGGSSS